MGCCDDGGVEGIVRKDGLEFVLMDTMRGGIGINEREEDGSIVGQAGRRAKPTCDDAPIILGVSDAILEDALSESHGGEDRDPR